LNIIVKHSDLNSELRFDQYDLTFHNHWGNLMFDFSPTRPAIERLCESLRVKSLAFFGSSVRDDFSDDSDFDALVSFADTDSLFDRYFELKEGLEALLDRRVDLVMQEAIRNPFFSQTVESEKVPFYAA